jgi:cbb3-type cytochrome oxidase subunit 3
MANLNRDYGKGKEFLFWTILFTLALVLLIAWIYNINFRLEF